MRNLIASLLAAAIAVAAAGASAETYPDKSIRLVIPFAPGGPTDAFARVLGHELSESWGQPVVPDNRPGATGTLGTNMVVKAPPNGYTFLMASTSSHVSAYLYRNQPYDPDQDLQPVINVITLPFYLVANTRFPAANLKELIAEVKRRPGFYTYSSPGAGSGGHLIMEMFKAAAGLDLIHVPYKGASPAIAAAVAGEVSLCFDTVSTAHPQVAAAQLKDYAVSGAARSNAVPDVPTVKESGYPDFEAYIWFGLFAPKGTPREIVDRLNAEVTRIMATPAMRQRVADLGGEFTPESPEQFHEFLKTDTERWRKVIASTGARAD